MDSALWPWVVALGSWLWFVVAAVFLLLELLAPGVFMLWLGLAAILIGIISLASACQSLNDPAIQTFRAAGSLNSK